MSFTAFAVLLEISPPFLSRFAFGLLVAFGVLILFLIVTYRIKFLLVGPSGIFLNTLWYRFFFPWAAISRVEWLQAAKTGGWMGKFTGIKVSFASTMPAYFVREDTYAPLDSLPFPRVRGIFEVISAYSQLVKDAAGIQP